MEEREHRELLVKMRTVSNTSFRFGTVHLKVNACLLGGLKKVYFIIERTKGLVGKFRVID